ncbi:MAG TPA: hypothetical protein VMX54_21395 [Vicinamibacteria bacterium]|nr:hypothetical protein [Vicinamibacteria bacterium]
MGAAEQVKAEHEALDDRASADVALAEIDRELGSLGGWLPPEEVVEELVAVFVRANERYARPDRGLGDPRALDLVARVSGDDHPVRPEDVPWWWGLSEQQLRERFTAGMARVRYESGPSSAERARRRVEAEAQRPQHLARHRHATERLAALGNTKPHHPDNQKLIEAEDARVRDEAQALRRQELLGSEIDQRHQAEKRKTTTVHLDQPSRTTHSQYLARGRRAEDGDDVRVP